VGGEENTKSTRELILLIPMPHVPSPLRLAADRSALLVIDLQEKLLPVIPSGKAVVRQTHRLLTAAKILHIPAAATVQYPQGLGPLAEPLRDELPSPEEKLAFSAAVCRGSLDQWTAVGRDQIVIAGIETHVCVQQTVLDLIAEGLRPYVAAEAVAARGGRDHETAIDRMRDCGATITTVESILFEWLGTAERDEFKPISKLIKEH
jgi:nicotinamidase-related amidase